MTHATELDLGPLTWVKNEIDLALARADESLEQALGAADAGARIQFAQTHLHQVRGALSIVGLDGLTQFAQSLDLTLGALARGEAPVDAAAIALARRALATLGNYLEELVHGTPDQPLRLFALYRDIAALRGDESASPAELFFPDLTLRPPRREIAAPQLSDEARQNQLRSQRALFQRGLLQWLRAPADPAGPTLMLQAVKALESLHTGVPVPNLWYAVEGFLEALAASDLAPQPEVKRLCSQIDAQLKRLTDVPLSVPDKLIRELLYWISQAPARTPQQKAVRATWHLDALVPEAGASVSATPLATLLKTLQGHMVATKQAWDDFSEGQAAALQQFEASLAALTAEASHLGRPPLDRLLGALGDFLLWLRKDPLRFNGQIAIEVATALLLAEGALQRGAPDASFTTQSGGTMQRLAALMRGEKVEAAEHSASVEAARRQQEREALSQVAREILSSLAQVEQLLDDYFRNQSKSAPLAGLAHPLKQIEGALTLIGDPDAIALVHEAAASIARFAGGATPDRAEFEALAQRLSALGFHIEALQHGPSDLQHYLSPAPRAAAGEEEAPPLVIDSGLPHAAQPPSRAEAAPAAPTEPAPAPAETEAPTPAEPAATEAIASAPEPVKGAALELPEEEGAPVAPPAATAPPQAESAPGEEIDAELLGIFIEEAHDVLATMAEELELSRTDPGDTEHLRAIRRGFHTLKGSGRMVGLRDLGEAAWGLEQTLNRWLQLEWPPTPALHHLVTDAREAFAEWVRVLEAHQGALPDLSVVLAEAERLRNSDTPISEPAAAQPIVTEQASAAPLEAFELEGLALGETGEILPVGAPELPSGEKVPAEAHADEPPLPEDAALLEAEEALPEEFSLDTLEAIELEDSPAEALAQPEQEAPSFELEALPPDTGEGIPREAPAEDEIEEIALEFNLSEFAPPALSPVISEDEAATADEALAETDLGIPSHAAEGQEFVLEEDIEPLAADETPAALEEGEELVELDFEAEEILLETPLEEPLEELGAPEEQASAAIEREVVTIGDSEISRPLYDLYLNESRHHLLTLHDDLARLRANPTLVPNEPSLRAAHTLAGISGTTRITSVQHLARAVEHAIERLIDNAEPPTPEQAALLITSRDTLEAMVAQVAARQMPLELPELAEQLDGIGRTLALDAEHPAIAAAPAATPPESRATAEVSVAQPAPAAQDELDEQLLPIFLEEGAELVSQLHAALRSWQSGETGEHAKATARLLHTLKGSARMAGAMTLGQHVHQLESHLEAAIDAGRDPNDLIDELVGGLDQAEQMFALLAGTPAEPTEAAPAIAAEAEAVAETEVGGATATLRVRADTVDRFVNEAGEIGIARTRIAGELRTLRRSLLDLTENVIRLRNQLREVEIQADMQMQSRIAHSGTQEEDFDPLEMDRYTRLQELTRMMAESVGDVTTVQQSLLRNLDAADIALNSQARLSRDLQQALMQVRMVPFESLADRLYRVTRQTARDLGKRANLDLRGGRIEIDRSVLEHITAPLEHLLRNAIAHGIEAPAARQAAGKGEIGQITLSVSQEGNEIAISLGDDGKGLDYDRIAERARANGLLGPDEAADERRLTNLIFLPGFSTAGNVSEVSGRGVGMDVVKSETAAVGGRIDIQSRPGHGTEFRIYLPLTLAVTQALLVVAGGRAYAIPSSMIAQVMELKADALDALRASGGTEWQDKHFSYRYLPRLVGDQASQPEVQRFNWVLLLRAGAQTLALHVDSLRGNQEIVVKNAGPQLARIVGISGATVLGDGEIVLILNPVALASRALAEAAAAAAGAVAEEAERLEPSPSAPAQQPTILVVDDSLTVRKITGRLLEREGYRVVTAKDGVDALEHLLELVPDVILSDIEMPRMDGFDLLRNIRADDRLRSVPVVMITSRLADKHRQLAERLGATEYLGKPYEEGELLGLLRQYTGQAETPH